MKRLFLLFMLLVLPVMAQDLRPSAYVGQQKKVTVRGGKVLGSTGGVTTIAQQDITPTVNATTYIYIDLSSTPVVATSTSAFPTSNYFPICVVITDINGIITSFTDSRPDAILASSGAAISSNVAVTCAASTTFTVASTFITDFFMNLNCNVTSSAIAGTLVTGNEIVMNLVQDSTGGRTFAWPTGFVNTPVVSTVPNAATVATFQYCGTVGNGNACPANSWQNTDVGPAGVNATTSSGPTSITLSPNCPNPNLGNCYFTPADMKKIYDASWTSGTTTVSCSNNDCNFTAADTGKSCWGIQSAGAYTFGNSLGTFTFVSAQSGTCVTGTSAVGTETATGMFAWGTNDTTPLTNATAALYALPQCGNLELPSGDLILAAGVGVTPAAPANCNGTTQVNAGPFTYAGANAGTQIHGQGRQVTKIHPAPGFDFSKCSNQGCFWALGSGSTYSNFGIDGLGASLSGISTSPATNLFTQSGVTGGRITDVFLQRWAWLASNNPGSWSAAGQSIHVENTETFFFGTKAAAGRLNCGNNTVMVGNYHEIGMSVGTNSFCYDLGGAYTTQIANIAGINISSGGTLLAVGTYTQEGASGSTVVDDAGTLFCYGCDLRGGTGSIGLRFQSGSGVAYLQNTKVGSDTTLAAVTNVTAGTGILYNEGGNSSTASPWTFSGTYVDLTGTFPSVGCTGVATASQTLGLYGTGPNVTLTTCTSTTIGTGMRMPVAGTVLELLATDTAAGVNASSGVVTVLKNGATQSMTCTLGTGVRCNDGVVAHRVTVAAGDLISIQFTTQAADTLAGVSASLVIW